MALRRRKTIMTNAMSHSGEGSRPTTDGGTDNIGAGEKFTGRQSPEGVEITGPAPTEKAQAKRQDAAAMQRDDSAPFNLHQAAESEPNTEPATVEAVNTTADAGRQP